MAIDLHQYVTATGLAADLRRRRDAADMKGDRQAADEVREIEASIASKEVIRFSQNIGYKVAEGMIKTALEKGYLADELGPDGLKLRVVTYEQGVLKVSIEATLAVEKDKEGNPRMIDGKYVTIHGLLDQAAVDQAQSALYAETSVKQNEALFAKIKAEYAAQVETAFHDGIFNIPVMFTPKNKVNLTELL